MEKRGYIHPDCTPPARDEKPSKTPGAQTDVPAIDTEIDRLDNHFAKDAAEIIARHISDRS